MKGKIRIILLIGIVLLFASCGEQHKAQNLVKDFLYENLIDNDCSFKKFSKISKTAMIDADRVRQMRHDIEALPIVKKGINYNDGAFPDTLLYIRATYKLTDKSGKQQEYTQTFYMDKALSRVIAFKEN